MFHVSPEEVVHCQKKLTNYLCSMGNLHRYELLINLLFVGENQKAGVKLPTSGSIQEHCVSYFANHDNF